MTFTDPRHRRPMPSPTNTLRDLRFFATEVPDSGGIVRPPRSIRSGARRIVHGRQLAENVATFCTTYVDNEVRRLMDLPIDKNMIDKDEYPQTAEIEMRCVHMLADLGTHRSGGNHRLLDDRIERGLHAGGLALKWQWRKRGKRKASHRQAELRLRTGAGVLGEIRPVLRRRDAPRTAQRRRNRTYPGRSGPVLRRGHS